jgi:hypothetical protein
MVESVGESDYFYGFFNDAVVVSVNDSTYTRLEQLHGNIHTNGAHKNNDSNTTPIFIGLYKTQRNMDAASRVTFPSKCILMSEQRKWNNIGIF